MSLADQLPVLSLKRYLIFRSASGNIRSGAGAPATLAMSIRNLQGFLNPQRFPRIIHSLTDAASTSM